YAVRRASRPADRRQRKGACGVAELEVGGASPHRREPGATVAAAPDSAGARGVLPAARIFRREAVAESRQTQAPGEVPGGRTRKAQDRTPPRQAPPAGAGTNTKHLDCHSWLALVAIDQAFAQHSWCAQTP